jgi:hypothetical protein
MATHYETHAGGLGSARRVSRRDLRPAPRYRLHDVRVERVGGFAGPVAPDDPVGTFANVRRLRRQGTGTFAGDADRRRQGSFADSVTPGDARARPEHFAPAA